MQCDQLQQHVNELLDIRVDIHCDEAVAAHLVECSDCRRLVQAYETMLLGVDVLAGDGPPEQFVQRTVDAVDARRRMAVGWRVGLLALAAAAAITVAFLPGWFASAQNEQQVAEVDHDHTGVVQQPAADLNAPAGASPQAAYALMWQLTGKNLASFPQTVRRVATHPDTYRIVGPMRPLAAPVGTAWEVLLRTLPVTPHSSGPSHETDTGLVDSRFEQYA